MIEAPQPDPTETTVPATTTPPDPIQELLDSMGRLSHRERQGVLANNKQAQQIIPLCLLTI